MDNQEAVFDLAKELGVTAPSARRLADISKDHEDLAIGAMNRLSDVPTEAGQSRYLQFKVAIEEAIRDSFKAKKAEQEDAKHQQAVREYERGREKGIIPTRQQLENMVAEAYDSGEILGYTPRHVPKELREDPEALKAKLLEWGIKGAALVKDMVAAAAESKPTDDDIPF